MVMAGELDAPVRLGSRRISRVLVAGSSARSVACFCSAAMRWFLAGAAGRDDDERDDEQRDADGERQR